MQLKILKQTASLGEMMKTFNELYEYTGYDKELLKNIPDSFYIDPASAKYHNSFKHGLLLHSCNVATYTLKNLQMMDKVEILELPFEYDEDKERYFKDGVFAGLFHDFCKIGQYLPEAPPSDKQIDFAKDLCKQNKIDNSIVDTLGKNSISDFINLAKDGHIEKAIKVKPQYEFNNLLRYGHGDKSVILLLKNGFKLTDHQILAIQYHGFYLETKFDNSQERYSMHKIMTDTSMLRSLFLADQYVGMILEA